MNKNKVRFGLKNVHYALAEQVGNEIVYGETRPFPGAVNLVLNPIGDKTEFYADDYEYFGATANQGYEGTLEVALIPDDFRADVLGEEKDINGVYFENADVIPERIALMYQFTGDKNGIRHVNYLVSIARPTVEAETKGAGIDPKTEVLDITASPRPDGIVKGRVEQGEAAYATFFDSVYEKAQAVNSAPADPEFDLNAKADVTFEMISSDANNGIKSVSLDGVKLNFLAVAVDDLEITIAEAYLTDFVVGEYPIQVLFDKGNAVSLKLKVVDSA